MNKLLVLVVVAAIIEGYAAASIIDGPENGEQEAKIVKREASNPFGNFFPFNTDFTKQMQSAFANADGRKSGNGHYISTSFISNTGVDANGKPVSSGVEVVDNDGQKTVRRYGN